MLILNKLFDFIISACLRWQNIVYRKNLKVHFRLVLLQVYSKPYKIIQVLKGQVGLKFKSAYKEFGQV
jgi:hypothetical protein